MNMPAVGNFPECPVINHKNKKLGVGQVTDRSCSLATRVIYTFDVEPHRRPGMARPLIAITAPASKLSDSLSGSAGQCDAET
jgi:hypothetical protein